MSEPESEGLANTLVGLYVLGEQQILDRVTRILRRTPATLAGVQAALPRIRTVVRELSAGLAYRSNPLVRRMLEASSREGRVDAEREIRRALPPGGGSGGRNGGAGTPGADDPFDLSKPHTEYSADHIRADIESELQDVRFRVTRLPDDIYKHIAPHGAIRQVLDNDVTPAQAQAMAWRVFTSQGVRGFTDKGGREWALSSYVEMAVRTASNRAYNASHLARMNAIGIHLFSVPDTGHPCPLCFPWQHAILSDGTPPPEGQRVDGTIAAATAEGLFHPNCKHTLLPYFPGITQLPPRVSWTQEMEEAYRMSQRQRHLELQVRKAKRSLEYALDQAARKEALADVRRAQARVREFVNANGLSRQSRREQTNLSDHKIKLPTPIR